jgi:hypothetical protein
MPHDQEGQQEQKGMVKVHGKRFKVQGSSSRFIHK